MGFSPRYVRDYFAQSKLKTVLIWIVEIALVILLAAGVSSFFCRSIVVQEGSMEPTLKAGDRALINSAAYKLSSPRRGDIVVFRAADDAKSSLHIKRVIGLPGETVQIKDGQILIDGKRYKSGGELIKNAGIIIENPAFLESESGINNLKYQALLKHETALEPDAYEFLMAFIKDEEIFWKVR